jgi:putative nucleotidyltransferase with HDIG domain
MRSSIQEELGRTAGDEEAVALVALQHALETRFMDLSQHGDRVAHYCALTARELGMDEVDAERVGLAGALHDIGKTTIDPQIFLQAGPPTPEQWDQIKQHPGAGYEILRSAGLDDVATWVLCHHERLDGLGYPRGLEAHQIPVASRILSVVDAYDAMVTNRVYREARAPHAAVAELRACAGTQFDPLVVETFVTVIRPSWTRAVRTRIGRSA